MNIYYNKIFFLMEKNMILCLDIERNIFCRIRCKINILDLDRKYFL